MDSYDAPLSIYENMSHYLADRLKLSPYVIMKDFNIHQLIITFGHYANSQAKSNYREFKSYDAKTRAKIIKENGQKPSDIHITFID